MTKNTLIYRLNTLNLIKSLSLSLELLATNLSFHHWRVAIIAIAIANELKISYQGRDKLLQASLLHDIGAGSSWVAKRLRSDLDSEPLVHNKYPLHAYNGYQLLKNTHCFNNLALIILHHHDNWNNTQNDPDIPFAARIIKLADYIELSIKQDKHILLQSSHIVENVARERGTLFNPRVVDAFLRVAQKEAFWLNIVERSYEPLFEQENNFYGLVPYSENDVMDIANLFAGIIDENSSFTYNHSQNVSRVSVFLASQKGFSDNELKNMMIAGLLHDIGKLSIPNTILEKQYKLNNLDLALIHQHSYYTYLILKQIKGFEEIATWAAYHHEHLDGSGYPFHLQGDELPLGSRIVAVADIFVALRENRPYKKEFSAEKIRQIMTDSVNKGQLDASCVQIIFDNLETISKLVDSDVTVKSLIDDK